MKKTVILLTTGTRGDIQPFIALGLGLQAAGISASLASDPRFASLAQAYDLPFIPVEGNPSLLMTQPGSQALTFAGSLAGSLRASLQYLKAARPEFEMMLEKAWLACQGARALVIGLPSLWGAHIAEALSIPCIYGMQQPFSRTSAFPSALLPPGLLPGRPDFNRFSHRMIELAVWLPWRELINTWRQTHLHLPPAPRGGIADRLYTGHDLVLTAVSPRVVPPPSDWPVDHHLTGFWFLDPPPTWQASQDLNEFIQDGPPPVYIGFGSPGPQQQQAAAELILQAAHMSGLRIAAALPAHAFPAGIASRQIFCLDDVPHAWLFPRCAALVHHGGSGTTAAGLRAGVPALVIPRATDQFFWGSRVFSLRCGPCPVPQQFLTAEKLSAALLQAVQDPDLKAQACQMGEALRSENGVANAVRLIAAKLS